MPLPHKDSLRRLISGMSCHFGFNSFALDAIEKNLADKRDDEKIVVISFDEVAITPSLKFNLESLAYDGFVNLSDDPFENRDEVTNYTYNRESDTPDPKIIPMPQLADHGLVFMARPLKDSWVMPFAVFASHGAASGEDLYRLLISAIIRLEVKGARVLCVVSDGATTNKKVWSLAGVCITEEGIIKNKICNPLRTNDQIFFLSDVPLVFKCMRNQMFNQDTVQVLIQKTFFSNVTIISLHQCEGTIMTPHQLVKDLYEVDSALGEGRLCPRLKRSHIEPTSFQKMNVSRAMQVSNVCCFHIINHIDSSFIQFRFFPSLSLRRSLTCVREPELMLKQKTCSKTVQQLKRFFYF